MTGMDITEITDTGLDLTGPVDADTYVRVVLQARADTATKDPRWPPLLAWMVRDADTPWVLIPDPEPHQAAPKKPSHKRPPADMAVLQTRLDRLVTERDRCGATPSDDPASSRLSGRTLRRVQTRMDRDLPRYTELSAAIRRLQWRINVASGQDAAP